MRTIIAGSRSINELSEIYKAVEACGWKPTVVISGNAAGADQLGEQWAEQNGVLVERYPADWKKYGKSAGFKRNAEMAEVADALIAVWDSVSSGTSHMIRTADQKGLQVYIHRITRIIT